MVHASAQREMPAEVGGHGVRYYLASDGARLGYERHGSGPLTVLVHAGFVDRRAWNALVPALAEDHTVVTPDRRGHGSSDGYRGEHRLDQDVDDLRRLLDLVAGRDGPALLVAHSAGCYVALGVATGSNRVAGLMLYEPPVFDQPPITPDVWDRLQRAHRARDRPELVALLLNGVVGRSTGQVLPPPALAAVLGSPFGTLLQDNALSIVTELRSYQNHRWDEAVLSRLRIPIRLLIGENSPPFNRLFADWLGALAPNATVEVLPGQDHGAPLNSPGIMAAAIRASTPPPTSKNTEHETSG